MAFLLLIRLKKVYLSCLNSVSVYVCDSVGVNLSTRKMDEPEYHLCNQSVVAMQASA